VNAPRPELDTRFSDPDARPTSWEDARQAIEQAQLFWISTVRADGRPHVTPLVAVWLDDALHFSTGPTEQKAHNLAANPHVVLTTGISDWKTGLDIVVEGSAKKVTDNDHLRELARAWARKWDGRWDYQPGDGGFEHPGGGIALVYQVIPSKILAFGKGTFSHTRYRL
jgi:nitroimidazol reductase NimA-like FMN-containing flavoprotein (pyridoxamine 5'-phosphate oxidase superfamily)